MPQVLNKAGIRITSYNVCYTKLLRDALIDRVSLHMGIDDDLMLILESDELEAPELELEAGISVVHLTA